ncbi:Fic family protein [Pseudomonas saudiphocaensis]|uniref:Fic family protein n=1 Tax=Pseudomonas saudiphocaensis TaxID=1499686 RepID=UPI00187D553E|nr:RNA-binding domain-containing protein [Pseudomonas saudiphocaensis]MBE7927349.1 putative DNA binding domain-containing protein [Pseudomonas saudiphocaensis]
MTPQQLQRILDSGEDSKHQFKRQISRPDSLAAELAAFSNNSGGRIFIGVADNGQIIGLDPEQVRQFNQQLSNAASNNIRPPIHPQTENIVTDHGVVIVVTVPNGLNKPYMDLQGRVWVKNGADKRHVTSREEMQRMFLNAGLIQADTLPIPGTTLDDLDEKSFNDYFKKRYSHDSEPARLEATLTSIGLAKEQQLTPAGILLFGKQPQRWLPVCMIKAVAFPGTSIADIHYQDSEDIYGTLQEQFQRSFSFIKRNLHHVQNGRGFNTLGELEVPATAIEELLVNALMHRDYFDSASIRILVFRDRIEIISPGHLPDNITADEIKQGKTKRRNPVLSDHAAHLLPYRGLGSGIHRALQAWPHIELQDHRNGNEFRAVVARPGRATDPVAPPVTGQVAGQVTGQVSQEVRSLLSSMQGDMKRAEIMSALNLAGRDNFRNLYLLPALEANLIEMTIPDKPQSSQQRYRLTAAGQQWLQQQHEKDQ